MNRNARIALVWLAAAFAVIGGIVWAVDAAHVHARNNSTDAEATQLGAALFGHADYTPAHENHTAPLALFALAGLTVIVATCAREPEPTT